MPNFNMAENQLITRRDKWLYFIKHLEDFENIPTIFKDEVFTQAFEKAELAKFDDAELDNYEYSLKVFRDNKNTFDYAMETAQKEGLLTGFLEGEIKGKLEGEIKGKLEGERIGKLDIAKNMKQKGLSVNDIAAFTGLTVDEIDKL